MESYSIISDLNKLKIKLDYIVYNLKGHFSDEFITYKEYGALDNYGDGNFIKMCRLYQIR